MNPYAERQVFSPSQMNYYWAVAGLVYFIPDDFSVEEIRCHELAHALARFFSNLQALDGHYGAVDHSWLWSPKWEGCHFLDPYAVGRVPQVQLVDTTGSPVRLYRPGNPRPDIDKHIVERLIQSFRDHVAIVQQRIQACCYEPPASSKQSWWAKERAA